MLTKTLNPTGSKTLRFSMVSLLLLTLTALAATPATAQEPAPAEPAQAPTAPAPAAETAPASQEVKEVVVEAAVAPAAPAAPAAVVAKSAPAKPTGDKPTGDAKLSVANKAKGEASDEGEEDVSLQEQIDEYWSSEGRDLNSLTDRIYSKDHRFAASFYLGVEPASSFWLYLTAGLRLTYYFNEYYGMEFSGSYLHGFSNELQSYLRSALGEGFNPDLQIGDRGVFRSDLLFVWRPLYGKFGLFNKKLGHFDFNMVIGMGLYGVNRPDLNANKASFAVEVEGTLGAGFAVFLSEDWTLRFDARAFMYRGAETVTEKTYAQRLHFPTEVSLGVSYLF